MSYNSKKVLEDNVTATALVLENTTGKYSPVQVEALKRYRGYGGLKAVLFGDGPLENWKDASKADRELYMGFRELYQVLDDNLTGREYRQVLESMKNSILTAFYTPSVIPATLYQVLNNYTEIESIYDPSAGTGVFIDEAFKNLKGLTGAKLYEKDLMTGKVLTAIVSSITPVGIASKVHVAGFEESYEHENGEYDLICSNIPYGAIPVFDPGCNDKTFTAKIHNYFFWKGLKKIKEGGLLGYLVTNAFLDTVTNQRAREYLFMNSDFISLAVMPDNLMKDIANTEAPSHFLVVRKNSNKTKMSEEEELLCVSENVTRSGTVVSMNKYLQENGHQCTIGDIKVGKNQYGKPNIEVWWGGPIEGISKPFREILNRDMKLRYVKHEVDKVPISEVLQYDGETESDIIEETAPWEDDIPEDPGFPIDDEWDDSEETEEERQERQRDMADMEMGEGEYEDEELAKELEEEINEHLKERGDIWEVPDKDTPDTEDEIVDLGHIAESIANPVQEVKVEYVDNLFNDQTVEFRPGTIMDRKVCTKDLFSDEMEIIQIQDITPNGQIRYTVPELKPKEQEIMRSYLKIRDAFALLEEAENDT